MLNLIARATKRVIDAVDQPAPGPSTARGRGASGDPSGDGPRHPRGIALVLALVTIAILATAVVEFTYSTRTNLVMAVNATDKVKSHFLARSSLNIARLLLQFQFSLQDESRESEDEMGRLISRAMRRSNFQMYQYIDLLMKPFTSGRLESPIGGVDLEASGVEGFGGIGGEFDAEVMPEEGKVDINQFGRDELDEDDIMQLCAMVLDKQYDDIFEQKDDSGETMDRALILGRIVDYIDPNPEALELTDECTIRSQSGDETRPYSRLDDDAEPRDALLTHIEELHQIAGMNEPFMRAFADQMTVYPVGRPNLNVATAPIFYSVLCRNVRATQGVSSGAQDTPFSLCARNPQVQMQVLYFALALDGVREFFSSPMSVLMAYVGGSESKLLPSAKKGQPVAFLSVSQLPGYLEDFQNNPQLMAQFLIYSPAYQRLVAANPALAVDPAAPNLPQWTIAFDRTGLMRSVSSRTPRIYRIVATGSYGSSESRIEAVVDFGKPMRRLPNEKQLEENADDPEQVAELKEALRQKQQLMPKGRVLYWREK